MKKSILILIFTSLALLSVSCEETTESSSYLENYVIKRTVLNKPMEFSILRPDFVEGESRILPVVMVLHGIGGNNRSLDEKNLSEILLEAMRTQQMPKVYFVMPDGEKGFYVNWNNGEFRYEDYIMQDVIPAAEEVLGYSFTKDKLNIVGMSMGGFGAAYYGFKYPDKFHSISSLSTLFLDSAEIVDKMDNRFYQRVLKIDDIFGEAYTDKSVAKMINPFDLVKKIPESQRPRFYMAAGRFDKKEFERTMEDFNATLDSLSYEHKFETFNGTHRWQSWVPNIIKAVNYSLDYEPIKSMAASE